MAQDYDINLKVKGLGAAANDLAKFTKELNEARAEGKGVRDALDKATGGAVTGFKEAASGAKTFIKGLKLTRAAIIATGIGALVVGVTALVGAFTSTRRGARQLQTIMAGLGAVVEQLTARFQAMGGFIVDLFSKGPQAAVKQYKETLDELPDSLQEAINKAMELERATQALTDAQRVLTVQRAKDRAEIKELNKIAEDTSKSLKEREAAAKEAIEIEQALMAERERIAAEELRIAQEKAAMSDSSDEDLNRLAELEANLINIRTESVELQTTLNNKLNTIRKEQKTKDEEAAKKRKENEEEVNKALAASAAERISERAKEENALDEHYKQLREKAKGNAKLLKRIDEQEVVDREELDKKYKKQEQAIRDEIAKAQMSDFQKAQQAVKEHYDKLITDAKGNAQLQKELEAQKQSDLLNLTYDAQEKLEAAAMSEKDAAIAANVKKYEELYALAEAAGLDTADLEKKQKEELRKIENDHQGKIKALSDQLAMEQMGAREQQTAAIQQELEQRYLAIEQLAATEEEKEQLRIQAREASNAKMLKLQQTFQQEDLALVQAGATATFDLLRVFANKLENDSEGAKKKAFERNKRIGIAETLVSTYMAAQKAYTSQLTATPDSPIRAVIAAAAATASGLARVAAIKSTQYSGGGSGGSAGDGGGGIGGGTQSVGVDVGSLIPNQQTPTPEPVRAYVVENEISNKQALNRELQIQTTL